MCNISHVIHFRWKTIGSYFFFCISGSRAERFSLNPNTGELRSASTLRRAEKAEYTLTVTVSDHGAPPQSISSVLRIQVRPLCDRVRFKPELTHKL